MLVEKLRFKKSINDLLRENNKPILNNIFIPYSEWVSNITNEDITEYKMIPDTRKFTSESGVYVVMFKFAYQYFNKVTNYTFQGQRYCFHGAADNASQITEKYKKLLSNPTKKFIIFLEPYFKKDNKQNDYDSWKRIGDYIGKYQIQNEYLKDEEDIEFVYKFLIYEVEKK